MSIPVTICDDSAVARKQLVVSLPSEWDISLSFAQNGRDGLALVREGKAEVLFLDLTMPIMDGYQVLKQIREEQLNTVVVVVSGDIQASARERVFELGAIGFVRKPVDIQILKTLLEDYGLISQVTEGGNSVAKIAEEIDVSIRDCYQEVSNVAMGQAANLLGKLFDAFVVLPIPQVNKIEVGDLKMALNASRDEKVTAVCQGFIGGGIAGEALIILSDSSVKDIARLMRFEGNIDARAELELIMDISGIFVGAFLKAFSEQLDIFFCQSHPEVLGQHCDIDELIKTESISWKETMAIEIVYEIEGFNVNCDLLIIFSEDSIEPLNQLVYFYSN